MAKILVFQHVAHEPLGILDPMLRAAKHRLRYVNFYREAEACPSIDKYDALIVLGGPMNVDEMDQYPHLRTEVAVIQQALKKDIPILGICLGAQLIAHALGANVYPAGCLEVGWYPLQVNSHGQHDPLLNHFYKQEMIFQWHGRTYDTPDDAINLVSSELVENQAFRYRDKVYGFQFHLEVIEPVINRWLSLDMHKQDLLMCGKYHTVDEEKLATKKYLPRSMQLAKAVFGEFIGLLPVVNNKTQLAIR
ncbi:MAG: C26 family cysteine hydrolase domain-containing family [Gammaproteobacteria bacterium]|nr:gamma-glutamyl-gamma-aminobutyrate hydrolase family protein [Gammaproteobacteria bacterium]NNC98500.1 C26 family cysteine hydrolase domain-containing family [Gammaproteobacteria bacterium]NNM13481.1 C26 family cysteine hydrolase domain-containing family [Gammaproteobacteria bacterium]